MLHLLIKLYYIIKKTAYQHMDNPLTQFFSVTRFFRWETLFIKNDYISCSCSNKKKQLKTRKNFHSNLFKIQK